MQLLHPALGDIDRTMDEIGRTQIRHRQDRPVPGDGDPEALELCEPSSGDCVVPAPSRSRSDVQGDPGLGGIVARCLEATPEIADAAADDSSAEAVLAVPVKGGARMQPLPPYRGAMAGPNRAAHLSVMGGDRCRLGMLAGPSGRCPNFTG